MRIPKALVLLLPAVFLSACGGEAGLDLEAMTRAIAGASPKAEITVDYPLDGSIFPPEFIPPTFLWHDPDARADIWLVEVSFADGAQPLRVLAKGEPPPRGEVDPEAFSAMNEPYEGTDYQRSARSWTPEEAAWEEIKRRSVAAPATVTLHGFASADAAAPLSRGSVGIVTSKDPVGAPIFYRDVPLMPDVGEEGRIKPLGKDAIPLIAWRLRDVSMPDSKLVLKGMSSCGNCHSFSLDGKTLGMDVDGPDGDKGMYAIKPVSKEMVIDYDDVITWNSFTEKPKEHRTIGFLSRISPEGRFVVTTVNEALYVQNFADFKTLQVFYPTRGILAVYSRDSDTIRALPGADDPRYVHCDPAWSPDGKHLVFSRAAAFDPYVEGQVMAKFPNDPNEPKIRYDLYRIPFNGGEGGKPVPVEGASGNGMSNTFPKVSPDGKWIVFVKCANGQLLRPDSRLWIVPFEGGEAREMRCNTDRMNSWHSFSPNGRWMVFASKTNTPYTQAMLTHIDEDGNDSPAILIPNCTAANRAVNLPEFLNASFDALDSIDVPAARHHFFLHKGEELLGQGAYEDAIASFEKAIEAEPGFSRAHRAIAFAMGRLGRSGEAARHLEIARELAPLDVNAQTNLGFAYLDMGRPEDAFNEFKAAIAIQPSFAPAHTGLGICYMQARRNRDAIEEFQTALDLDPTNGRVHLLLSGIFRRLGRTKDGVKHLSQAAELLPDDPGVAMDLAFLLATSRDDALRDGPRAVKLAERAVSLTRARRPEALDVLAAALAESGRFEEAVQAGTKALALARKTNAGLASQIEKRLALYRSERPLRTGTNR